MCVENMPVLLIAHFVASEGRQSGLSESVGQAPLLPPGVTEFGTQQPPPPKGELVWTHSRQLSQPQELKKEILSGLKDDVEKQKQWNETSGCLVSLEQPLPTNQRNRTICWLKREQKRERARENNSIRKYLSNVSSFHGHLWSTHPCCASPWPSHPTPSSLHP